MHFNKKLNLLPERYKDRHATQYILLGFGSIFGILILIMLVTYVNVGISSFGISRLQKENTEYQAREKRIVELEESIVKNKELIKEYERTYFPFYRFMQWIEYQKPYGLTLISIDSADRLANDEATSSLTPRATTTPSPPPREMSEASKKESTLEKPQKTIGYNRDLSGEKLVIRGYSANPSDIALFVANLSKSDYVEDLELKAIEEHTINGTERANIFEAVLRLK